MDLLYFLIFSILLVVQTNGLRYEDVFQNVNYSNTKPISASCQNDIEKINNSSIIFWKMANSSGELSEFKSNYSAFMGDFEKCLEISEIQTKFCTVFVKENQKKIPLRFMKRIGLNTYVCVPNSCTSEDLNFLGHDLLSFPEGECVDGTKLAIDDAAIVAMTIFGLIALAVVLSTSYNIWILLFKMKCEHPTWLAFSLYNNGKNLFTVNNSNAKFPCLNGLKSISTLIVVAIHSSGSLLAGPIDNALDYYNMGQSPSSEYFAEMTLYSVDTFFVVRGFLTAYSFTVTVDKEKKFKFFPFFMHRYLKLTPPLAALVLFNSGILNYLGSGPFWKNTDVFLVEPCKQYWWSVIFYIQNYSSQTLCAPHAWFLSVDMQIFAICPIFLCLMRYKAKWGYTSLSLFSLICIMIGFIASWFLELSGSIVKDFRLDNAQIFQTYFYSSIYLRISPYFFGIMLYYFIDKLKKSKTNIKLYKKYISMGWLLSNFLPHICLFLIVGNFFQGSELMKVLNSLLIALKRPTWSITICWMIFACEMGLAGDINRILSLSTFQVLSKLGYGIYLIHFSWIFLSHFSRSTPIHFSVKNTTSALGSDIIISILLGLVWYLVFEAPFLVLTKDIFKKKNVKKENLGNTNIV